MADDGSGPSVAKLLTFVFENDAPLPIVERCDLADGMYLATLPRFLLEKDEDYHLLAVTPRFSAFFRDHLHATTLNVEYLGKERLNYEGVTSPEATSKKHVDDYLLAGMLHTPHFLAPFASFVTIPSQSKVCNSSRMKEFGRFEQPEKTILTPPDFLQINELYSVIRDLLSSETTGRLPTALRLYQQAFRTDIDWSVRFLGMTMGIEAIFSRNASEISHQVSERTSFFLKSSPDEREQLYDQMRSHYALRSDIAHGGNPSEVRKTLESSFGQLLHVLRDTLVKILKEPSLMTLFTSSSSTQFKEAMRRLLFRGELVASSIEANPAVTP